MTKAQEARLATLEAKKTLTPTERKELKQLQEMQPADETPVVDVRSVRGVALDDQQEYTGIVHGYVGLKDFFTSEHVQVLAGQPSVNVNGHLGYKFIVTEEDGSKKASMAYFSKGAIQQHLSENGLSPVKITKEDANGKEHSYYEDATKLQGKPLSQKKYQMAIIEDEDGNISAVVVRTQGGDQTEIIDNMFID